MTRHIILVRHGQYDETAKDDEVIFGKSDAKEDEDKNEDEDEPMISSQASETF